MDKGVKSEPASTKKKDRRPESITVSAESLQRINRWREQVESQLKGINLTRGQIVDCLIAFHVESLSQSELKQIEKAHFDEVKFAKWALRELKAAKARGEEVTLADLVSTKTTKSDKPASHRSKKNVEPQEPIDKSKEVTEDA